MLLNNRGDIMDDKNVELLKTAMSLSQDKYDEQNRDNYILRCKNPMAYLEPGDQVKVYYTTNAAKGWIMVRCGKPNYRNEYGQYINDIRNRCDDDDDGDNGCCCDTTCCEEAATRQQNKDAEVVEEWDERIEGTEDEIREYVEKEGKNSPFYNFNRNGGGD